MIEDVARDERTTRPAAVPLVATVALPALRLRLRTLDALSADDHAQWATLAAGRADDANVFAQPHLMIPGLRHCSHAGVMLAWVEDAGGTLIGVAPLSVQSRLGRMAFRHARIWRHPNAFVAPVLIARGHERAFWQALVAARVGVGPLAGTAALFVDALPQDSRAWSELAALAHDTGLPLAIEARHERAMLVARGELADYWDRHVRAKKRKELRRQWARLGECGTLTVTRLAPDADAGPWIAEFLALEAQGWKGRAGSALACAPATAAFFGDVVTEAHRRDAADLTALRLDGRAVAMLATLYDRNAAFSFKTAFDETLARFSPGVLIQREWLAQAGGHAIEWVDSCAAPDHPMIDSLWADRRAMLSVLIARPDRSSRLRFAARQAMKSLWTALRPEHRQSPRPGG